MKPIFASLLPVALGLASCTGVLGDPPPAGDGAAKSAACEGIQPGASPLRRLTRFEYDNTVRDLLGDDSRPASAFVAEEESLGFDNQATALGVSELLAEEYMQAAEKLSRAAVQDLPALLGDCKPAQQGEDACGRAFIASFGERAYRRPLGDDETDQLHDLFAWGQKEYGFATGIELVLQAMLQSPSFLYRVELGAPSSVDGQDDIVPLGGFEIASRLSYLLWASTPDETLYSAAEAGDLATAAGVEEQARRMLADPRAREAVSRFGLEWLGLTTLDTLSKDPSIYPEYTPEIRDLLRREAALTFERIVLDDGGDVAALFEDDAPMMSWTLAGYYGLDGGPGGDDFEPVALPPERRGGLLRLGAVLATHAKPDRSSPVLRGKLVRERLLCQTLPLPPANIDVVPPVIGPDATTREAFAEHSTNPACAGCHQLMDPIGFGFEHYDGIGRYRAEEHGQPIDASGDLEHTSDAIGEFDGLPELAGMLAESDDVRRCLATQWFRYGYGHAEGPEDRCAMEQLQTMFAASGYRIEELLVALTQTDAFRYRKRIAEP